MVSNIFGIFTPIWGRFPFWLIFLRWVETTNQSLMWGFPCFFSWSLTDRTKPVAGSKVFFIEMEDARTDRLSMVTRWLGACLGSQFFGGLWMKTDVFFLRWGRVKSLIVWRVYVGTTPHPVTVTTRIIPFLVGNPYKPSFVTGILGGG